MLWIEMTPLFPDSTAILQVCVCFLLPLASAVHYSQNRRITDLRSLHPKLGFSTSAIGTDILNDGDLHADRIELWRRGVFPFRYSPDPLPPSPLTRPGGIAVAGLPIGFDNNPSGVPGKPSTAGGSRPENASALEPLSSQSAATASEPHKPGEPSESSPAQESGSNTSSNNQTQTSDSSQAHQQSSKPAGDDKDSGSDTETATSGAPRDNPGLLPLILLSTAILRCIV